MRSGKHRLRPKHETHRAGRVTDDSPSPLTIALLYRPIANEGWIRAAENTQWSSRLVQLFTDADHVFPGSTTSFSARTITRQPASGFTLLDKSNVSLRCKHSSTRVCNI